MNSRERLKKRALVMYNLNAPRCYDLTAQELRDFVQRMVDEINAAIPVIIRKVSEWLDVIAKTDVVSLQHKLAELQGEQHESE